jgi:hypothetical protein
MTPKNVIGKFEKICRSKNEPRATRGTLRQLAMGSQRALESPFLVSDGTLEWNLRRS